MSDVKQSETEQYKGDGGLWRSTGALLRGAVRAGGAAPQLGVFVQTGVVIVCVGLATAVRAGIGLVVPDVVPFATYFPAIAIAAVIGGFWTGVAAWLLSILLGLVLFMDGSSLPFLTLSQATSVTLFAASAALELLLATWLRDLFWNARRNENRYRALVEASSSLISIFDANGLCRDPQPGWEALTGMQWPSYQGLKWMERVHEDDRAKLTADSDKPTEVEVRIWDTASESWRWFVVRAVPLFGLGGAVEERIGALTDITERKAAREHRELLLEDMRHRLKNFIAVIQALVMTAKPKGNADVDAFAETFLRRVRTLQSAADLVMKANATDVDLAEVVPAALAPFFGEQEERISIEGPSIMLKEHTVGAIALACHELATNAAKYGALTTGEGKVAIKWDAHAEADAERIVIEWAERGGPPVKKPTRQSLGTRIINAAVARESNGVVDLDYRPTGLICRMTFVRKRDLAA